MENSHPHGAWRVVTAMFVLTMSPMAWGQFAGTNDPQNVAGRTALENVSTGAVGLRRPGDMVISGIARASTRVIHPRIGVDIQATSEPQGRGVGDVFFPQAIEIIFGNLNLAINLFENAIRAQAGQPPVLPPSIPTDPTDQTAPDDTTTPSEDDTTVETDESGETGDETTAPPEDESQRGGIRS